MRRGSGLSIQGLRFIILSGDSHLCLASGSEVGPITASVELLSREGEIAIAKRIEAGATP
jgi:hypothetical protein